MYSSSVLMICVIIVSLFAFAAGENARRTVPGEVHASAVVDEAGDAGLIGADFDCFTGVVCACADCFRPAVGVLCFVGERSDSTSRG